MNSIVLACCLLAGSLLAGDEGGRSSDDSEEERSDNPAVKRFVTTTCGIDDGTGDVEAMNVHDEKGDCYSTRRCDGKVLKYKVLHCHNCKGKVSGKSILHPDGTCEKCK